MSTTEDQLREYLDQHDADSQDRPLKEESCRAFIDAIGNLFVRICLPDCGETVIRSLRSSRMGIQVVPLTGGYAWVLVCPLGAGVAFQPVSVLGDLPVLPWIRELVTGSRPGVTVQFEDRRGKVLFAKKVRLDERATDAFLHAHAEAVRAWPMDFDTWFDEVASFTETLRLMGAERVFQLAKAAA